MKISTKIALGAVAVLLVAALQPAMAACGGAPVITSFSLADGSATPVYSRGQALWSTNWGVSPTPPCYGGGCYINPGEGPLSPNAKGVFWSLGTGNPDLGPGDDNGTYSFGPGDGSVPGPIDSSVWLVANYFSTGTYSGPISIVGNWNLAADGCVFNAGATTGIDETECTCVLLTDQDGDDGYFALISNTIDGIGNSDLSQGSAIILEPMPKVEITGSVRNPTTFDIDSISAQVNAPTAGLYEKGGCECGPTSYRVLAQSVPRGNPAPSDRSSGWVELALAGGGAQGDTPIGQEVDLTSACGSSNVDLYLTAELIFDSGYKSGIVSGNSTRVECGPNIANPEELNRRQIQLPSRGSQGKGGSRGR